MAMLISKFHRLIQSRLVWGGLLIIIVFSFVIWGMQTPGKNRRALEETSPGKLDGEFVDPDEFRAAYFNSYLSVVLAVGRAVDSSKLQEELRDEAWKRLVTLRAARKLGIGASDAEVISTVQHHPGFVSQGRFSQVHYNAFVGGLLAPMGVSESQFEEHVRQEIVIQKLRQIVEQGVLVSPFEVERAFSSVTDAFDVDYVELTPDDVRAKVKVTDEKTRAFFEKDPKVFTLPPKMRVEYVCLPADGFVKDVTVTEDDAIEYYNDNLDEFTDVVVTTNALDEAIADTNALDFAQDTKEEKVTRPFEDVKDGIIANLTHAAAIQKAVEKCTDLAVDLSPDREGNAPKFEEVAARFGLEVVALPPFAADEELASIDAGLDFNTAAFALSLGAEDYVSDAVPGSNNVYVIALREKFDARVPEFEEVAGEVREAVEEDALARMLVDTGQELREAALKGIAEGETLADVAKAFTLKGEKLEGISAASDFEEEDKQHGYLILRAVLVRNEGELTELVPAEGGIILAHVVKRTPGDLATLTTYRPQIVQALRRDRSRLLFEGLRDDLLRKAHFEERKAPEPEPEDEEYEEEIPEEAPDDEAPVEMM